MSRDSVGRTADYSALTAPTTPAEIRAFREQTRLQGTGWGFASTNSVVVTGLAAAVGAVVVVGFVGTAIARSLLATAEGSGVSFSGFLLPVLIVAAAAGFIVLAILRRRANWERWMRLSRFADANRLVFSPSDSYPQYPGTIFGLGGSRVSLNHLRSASTDRFLDMGSYQYVTGSGKSRTTHNWGFLALHLDRKLPQMILDAKSNNSWFGSNLPSSFTKEQVLSLEGDFDKYFTLYCPKEYERDALQVFTPDLMALLIDEAAPFDVEIVDDWMFVYSSRSFAPTDPAVYQRLFRIIDTVGAKTLSQTDRYSDERIGNFAANTVAPQGRRLRKGFPIVTIVIVVVGVMFWLLPQLMQLSGR